MVILNWLQMKIKHCLIFPHSHNNVKDCSPSSFSKGPFYDNMGPMLPPPPTHTLSRLNTGHGMCFLNGNFGISRFFVRVVHV